MSPRVISKLPHKSSDTRSEKLDVLRYLTKFLNKKGESTLTEANKLDHAQQHEISLKGELAELVFGGFDQDLLWKHRADLVKKGGLLEGYEAMNGARLLGHFEGAVTGMQVAFTYNEANEELSVAFSGTSSFLHFYYDADFRLANFSQRDATPKKKKQAGRHDGGKSDAKLSTDGERHGLMELLKFKTSRATDLPKDPQLDPNEDFNLKKTTSFSSSAPADIQVHEGFLKVYNDIEQSLVDELSKHFASGLKIKTFSIIGHSLGAAQTFLLAMMLLEDNVKQRNSKGEEFKLPGDVSLRLFAFGCPRIGPLQTRSYYLGLVKKFRKVRGNDDAFIDCSSRNYKDWVPCVPLPSSGNYTHLAEHSVYEFGGSLYEIPSKDYDCTVFSIELPDGSEDPKPKFPRGGHCFYNDRDLFALIFELQPWLKKKAKEEEEETRAKQ